jgi:hypothetical protein
MGLAQDAEIKFQREPEKGVRLGVEAQMLAIPSVLEQSSKNKSASVPPSYPRTVIRSSPE